ncbi:MAG: UDP-N-acetylmuramoyl-tripeptide--D-alanyl-D-alanine ligase [Gammaproteobacteria bacterium]|nr:UDP-N-acetylmuramoyl-tripeptide--D-alanyl-D-alanine ligase [Gammaproteobacteria bacterium]
MSLSEVATVTRGQVRSADARRDGETRFTGVATDSRSTRSGDLFVAIHDGGGGRDGHDFIGAAAARGAVAALVSRDAGPAGFPTVHVGDTTAALGALGAHWRRRFDLPVVAVTGSNGKTTVTALVASIFNAGGNCLAPRASFNNQWGVPLTLLRLRESHTHAVIEMGMNHAGEIAYLTGLARPDVALINNVAPAHLAGLTDLHGVAAAKAEIFQGLGADGIAVLNADDRFHDFWREELRRLKVRRMVRFTSRADGDADIRAAGIDDRRIELDIAGESVAVDWQLPGAHNLANAAAAAAAAHAAGATAARIGAGLSAFPGALPGRLFTFTGLHGATVIDDSYNANPASMRVALEHLAAAGGARIAALGRMAELGEQSAAMHRDIGRHARACGVEHLLCLGPPGESRAADDLDAYLRGFGGGERFDSLERLLARLLPLLDDNATVLIKGSRSTDMGRVAAQLKPSPDNSAAAESTVAAAGSETVAESTVAPAGSETAAESTVKTPAPKPGGPPC